MLKRGKIACNCRNVTYAQIEDAVQSGAKSVPEVMDITGAGKSCGKCREFLEHLVRDMLAESGRRSE